MIITVEQARKYIKSDETDEMLEARLQAVEMLIRKYTNNNFQNRKKRFCSAIEGGSFRESYPYIKIGDTVQITDSRLNDGLYLYSDNMELLDEPFCLVTKIEYPADVVMGTVNMLKWDIENRDKVGIQSETISRHSVTYFNMDGENSVMGYPKSLLGFLKPYMKARF
jgi:hypothetical protein